MNDKEPKQRSLAVAFSIYFAIFLLLLTPAVHHALLVNYSLFNFDGLVLLAGIGLISTIMTFFARHKDNIGYAVMVGGALSLLIDYLIADYFMPRAIWQIMQWASLSLVSGYLLWKLGPKSAQIVTAFCLAFLIGDITFDRSSVSVRMYEGQHSPAIEAVGDGSRPVIHLVFDAFQAPSALPKGQAATAEIIRSYFVNNGFYLYDKAFSRYNRTYRSLPDALNFGQDVVAPDLESSKVSHTTLFEHYLGQNQVLATMAAKGLNAHIIQTNHLDLCVPPPVRSSIRCSTYSTNDLPRNKMLNLPIVKRLELFLMLIGEKTIIYRAIRFVTNSFFGGIIVHVRSPLTDFIATDLTKKTIKSVDAKTYIFVHSLISHSPYALNNKCLLRPVSEWSSDRRAKTIRQRKVAYRRYGQQLECSLKHVSEILDHVAQNPELKNAIVLIHGDHGSRISVNKIDDRTDVDLSNEDLLDNFPTLFAVRHPDIKPGIDNKPVALDSLLRHYLKEMDTRPYPGPAESQIYLLQKNGILSETHLDMGDQ